MNKHCKEEKKRTWLRLLNGPKLDLHLRQSSAPLTRWGGITPSEEVGAADRVERAATRAGSSIGGSCQCSVRDSALSAEGLREVPTTTAGAMVGLTSALGSDCGPPKMLLKVPIFRAVLGVTCASTKATDTGADET